MRLVSPNEMIEQGKTMMLDGRDPMTKEEWAVLMNFVAFNVHKDVASQACKLMKMIYFMPLTDDEVDEIVAFQLARK